MFKQFLKICDIPRASVSEIDFCSELKNDTKVRVLEQRILEQIFLYLITKYLPSFRLFCVVCVDL